MFYYKLVLGMEVFDYVNVESKSITRINEKSFIVEKKDVAYLINNITKANIDALTPNAFNIPDGATCKVLGDGTIFTYRSSIDGWIVQ